MQPFVHIDLGPLSYAEAYQRQTEHHVAVLANRESNAFPAGIILTVEHPPVITISRRPNATTHLLASRDFLASQGIAVEETDRGGDITYHGPGQLVVYPIIDLNRVHLGLHDYMRLLEQVVIDTCETYGVIGHRDPGATGVWVQHNNQLAKVAAFGVRVRRWVSMHGLALNVTTNLQHFSYIVPCGLAGRPVTSLQQLLTNHTPAMEAVRSEVVHRLQRAFQERLAARQKANATNA